MGNFYEDAKTLGLAVTENLSARTFTTIKTGGNARYFVALDSVKKISDVAALCREYSIPYKVIGNGSNLLFSDKGFNGLIISAKNLKGISLEKGKIKALSGENLSELVRFAVINGFTGMEGLMGIPATVGGAIVQNASAFSYSLSDYIERIESEYMGKLIVRDKNECKFSYRNSIFKRKKETVISAVFSFPKGKPLSLNKFTKLREISQPKGNTFGSVFANPEGYFAGSLIEKAGLKGKETGGAKVSFKHANFIVNTGSATSDDVYRLIYLIKKKVYDSFGIVLKEEVEYVGEF